MSKFFFLAGVTVFAGVFAIVEGCSSSDSTTTTDTDAGADSSTPRPRDAAPPEPVDAGPAVCPTTDPIAESDISPTWMPPPVAPDGGACDQANIDGLKAAFADAGTGGLAFTDIKTALGTTCAGCAFSPFAFADGGANPQWSVFVDVDGGSINNTTGSCFAHFSGNACGKLRFEFERCLRIACPLSDCQTDSKVTKCKQDAQKIACKDITDKYAAACPDETTLLNNGPCSNIYGAIVTQCGAADAGLDSSL